MKWILPFLIFAIMPLRVEAAINIGFVDLRKALNAVEDGRYAKERLKKTKKKYQDQLKQARNKLKKEKKAFDAKAAILRGEAKRKAQLKLQKKFIALQQMYGKLTRTLARSESKETRKIFAKMEGIIRKIAQENKLILVLEKTESSVLYALPSMDYTNELIRRYDRIYGSKKGKKSRKRKRK